MDHVNYVIRNQCRTSAYGPVMFQEPEHQRNIALATKAMQDWTVLALIACLCPSSLSTSSCNPTRLRGAFSQRSGLLDTSWSSVGNGNCITLRKALDLCVLAMTRVSHAVLLYSISPYAVIGKIYDSCAKEHTKHAKNTVCPRMNKALFESMPGPYLKKGAFKACCSLFLSLTPKAAKKWGNSLLRARNQWGKVRELLRHARHHILTWQVIGHVS